MEKHQNPIYALNVLLRWACCILLFWMGLQYLITVSTLCFWLGALFLLPKKGRASLLWTLLAALLISCGFLLLPKPILANTPKEIQTAAAEQHPAAIAESESSSQEGCTEQMFLELLPSFAAKAAAGQTPTISPPAQQLPQADASWTIGASEQTVQTSPQQNQPDESVSTPSAASGSYVLNTSSMKFHLPSCRYVAQMDAENKKICQTREEAVALGGEPCKVCQP